jgi:rhodanese-related sulfurtransferase
MKRTWLFTGLVLLLAACGGGEQEAIAPAGDAELSLPDTVDVDTVAGVMERDDVVVLDVREPWEYEEGHIPGVQLIPMAEISERLDEVPAEGTVIVTCRSGNRSAQVTDYLRQQGYDNVHNMEGGILAWEAAGYEVEP